MNNKRINMGLSSLVFSGLFGMLAIVVRGNSMFPANMGMNSWRSVVTSKQYLMSQYSNILFAYSFAIIGFWAIYMILSQKSDLEKMSFWAMMLCILGTAIALPNLGVFAYVSPVLAEMNLGHDISAELIHMSILKKAYPISILSAVFYTTGTMLLGIGGVKSKIIGKWAGVLIAVHGILLSFAFSSNILLIIGWLLLSLVGVIILRHIKKEAVYD